MIIKLIRCTMEQNIISSLTWIRLVFFQIMLHFNYPDIRISNPTLVISPVFYFTHQPIISFINYWKLTTMTEFNNKPILFFLDTFSCIIFNRDFFPRLPQQGKTYENNKLDLSRAEGGDVRRDVSAGHQTILLLTLTVLSMKYFTRDFQFKLLFKTYFHPCLPQVKHYRHSIKVCNVYLSTGNNKWVSHMRCKLFCISFSFFVYIIMSWTSFLIRLLNSKYYE